MVQKDGMRLVPLLAAQKAVQLALQLAMVLPVGSLNVSGGKGGGWEEGKEGGHVTSTPLMACFVSGEQLRGQV